MRHYTTQDLTTPRTVGIALIVVALAAGCNDSDDDDAAGTDFNTFVIGLIDDTSETTEPVSLEGRNFVFDEDPAAFDTLFD